MKDRLSLARELQEDNFHRSGLGWFKVVSGSMYPVIEINDRVLVKKIAIDTVKSGDIILFKIDGKFIVHRIIKIMKKDGSTVILQKGDAKSYPSMIFLESIVGKVISIEKRNRIIELDSLQGKCINILPVVRNCFFYKNLNNRKQSAEGGNRSCLPSKGFFWIINKSFIYCNRIILRILLHGI
jgi:signal peptidase I